MTRQPACIDTRHRPLRFARQRLLLGGATALAIVAVTAAPQQARAQLSPTQSFQGSGTVVSGSASIAQTGTQDTVRINSPEAVINWRPNDTTGTGSINFLPSGRRVQFLGDADFTVFNRILPVDGAGLPVSRLIEINGQIDSFVLGQQGGSVWFYTPGGILVGGTGLFNVGSLVLTTRDIDTTGGLFGPGGAIRFGVNSPATTGTVTIANGARINANVTAIPGSSYVALVAPRIEQAGTINANGSVALVAAEAVDITLNAGLFDIQVTTGSGDANGIVHTGSTGGPTDSSAGFDSRAYLVAIPKSQAMTMLLSGTVGFQTNLTAGIDATGGIVLSAGNNISAGADAGDAGATGRAGITIADTLFWNTVNGVATGSIVGRPTLHCAPNCLDTSGLGQIGFYRGGTLSAADRVDLSAGQAQRIFSFGDLSLLASSPGVGGIVNLTINDVAAPVNFTGAGQALITGSLLLDASTQGEFPVNDGDALGGTATLSATGGSITAGQIEVRADAEGGLGDAFEGRVGRGGTARVVANTGGSITTSFGAINVTANGTGGRDQDGIPINIGGNGFGGTASVSVTGGTVAAAQGVGVAAQGLGGVGRLTSGNGTGGTASIAIVGPTSVYTSNFTSISASGTGGGTSFVPFVGFVQSASAGNGTGGTAAFSITNGPTAAVDLGFLTVEADGRGGEFTQPGATGVTGANGRGGTARFRIDGGNASANFLSLRALGIGSSGTGDQSNGGAGFGGVTELTLSAASSLDLGFTAFARANGTGGVGTNASGQGRGGTTTVRVAGTATLTGSSLTLEAIGFGGGTLSANASFAPDTSIGGAGTGGLVSLDTSGIIDLAALRMAASGIGGDSNPPTNATVTPAGGDGTGGTVNFTQTAGSTETSANFEMDASAYGGSSGSTAGSTGRATGGSITARVLGGTLNTFGTFGLYADAEAGNDDGGAIRQVAGGLIELTVDGGAAMTVEGALEADASAFSSAAPPAATSSEGWTGGTIAITVSNGSLNGSELFANAQATGAAAGGSGGTATGGNIFATAGNAGTFAMTDGATLEAQGTGGNGFEGALGVGGTVIVEAADGTIDFAGTDIDVEGVSGGLFGAGSLAAAQGGAVTIRSSGTAGDLLLGDVTIIANGRNASTATAPAGFGGPVGGDARGGIITFELAGRTTTAGSADLFADGIGTAGGTGTGGTISITQTGGDATFDDVLASVEGRGGNGLAIRDGGRGRGGTASLTFAAGGWTANLFTVRATGTGGAGANGFISATGEAAPSAGGFGDGGTITLDMTGGLFATGTINLTADGRGGNGGNFDPTTQSDYFNPGSGGSGTGGRVTASLDAGTVNGTLFQAYARGRGGAGGRITGTGGGNLVLRGGATPAPTGGSGIGGEVVFRAAGAVYDFAPLLDVSAQGGAGGAALDGADGGNATGGQAEAIIDDVDAGIVAFTLQSSAVGGAGGNALHGTGGEGGSGIGGRAVLRSAGIDARATIGSSQFQANGTGGAGGTGAASNAFAAVSNGFDGGAGSIGIGGEVTIISGGGELLLDTGNGFNVDATGGDGGAGANNPGSGLVATFGGNGGAGGNATGGIIGLVANDGTLGSSAAGTTQLSAGATAGSGGAGGSGTVIGTFNPATGQTTFSGGNGFSNFEGFSFGGTVRLVATATANSLLALDTVQITAGGDFAGRVELIDDSDGAGLDLGAVSVLASGSAISSGSIATSGSGIYLRSNAGAMQLDSLFVTSGGTIQFDAIGTGGFNATGAVNLETSGDIIVNHTDRPAGTRTIGAAEFVAIGGRIALTGGTSVRGSDLVLLNALTDIEFDAIETNIGPVDAFAGGFITGNSVTTFDGDAALQGRGVSLDSANIGGILTIIANDGSIALGTALASADIRLTAADAVDIVSATTTNTGPGSTGNPADIIINATGAVTAGTLNAAENLFIDAGSLNGPTSTLAAGNQIGIITATNAVFGNATAGDLSVEAGGGIRFNSAETSDTLSMTAAGDISGNDATSRNANVSLRSTGGSIIVTRIDAGLDAVLEAADLIDAQLVRTASGDVIANGGSVTIGGADAGNRVSVTSGGNARLSDIRAIGDIIVDAGGAIIGGDFLSASGGTIDLTAATDIALTGVATTGAVNLDGGSITAAATGVIRAGTSLDALARTGNIILGNVEAGSVNVDATAGTVNFRNMSATQGVTIDALQISGASVTTPATAALTGANGVDLSLLHSGGAITLLAANGTVRVADLRGPAIDARGRAIDLTTTATSTINVARATAGNVLMRGDSGNLSVGDAEASGNIDIRVANGTLAAGRLVGTDIIADGGLGVTLSGNQTASGLLDIRSRRTATVNGSAIGATISVTSGDIAIGSNGRIGQAGTTTQLTLTNGQSSVRTFIGGNDTTAGYSLSAAEMLRLYGNNVTMVAPQVVSSSATSSAPTSAIGLTRQPDLVIDAFTFNGGGGAGSNLGSNGTLRISTPGFARVIGAAQLANAAPGNRLTLVGQQSLEIILGQGSVRVTNGGALAGSLELISQDVVVATASAITDIAAAAGDLSRIEDRLASNDGFASDEGAISANAISITANGVYIQNTGAGTRFAERRGYTAGTGGLIVNFLANPASPVRSGAVVMNGRTSDGAGGFLTGLDAFPTVTIGGVVLTSDNQSVNGLVAGSTLNGCDILGAGTCREFTFVLPDRDNPLIDEDDEESGETGGESDPPGVLVDIRELGPLPNEPLVDDPVTGAGNDDLWAPLPE